MKIELDLYSPSQWEAFADYLKTSAAAMRAEQAAEPKHFTMQWRQVDAADLDKTASEVRATEQNEEGETPLIVHETAPAPAPAPTPAPTPARRGRKPKATAPAEPAQISTGEARVGPEDPPEDAIQDAADEQAETDARKAADPALTRDDLRAAMGRYVTAYGLPAAQEDGVKIFDSTLGPIPAGTKKDNGEEATIWSLSVVPEDLFAKAVAGWDSAAEKNPFERARV